MKKVLRGNPWVTLLVKIGLLCLCPSSLGCVAQGGIAESRRLDAELDPNSPAGGVQTCNNGATLELKGAGRDFQFKCDGALKLLPVEKESGKAQQTPGQKPDEAALKKVYSLGTPANSAKSCGSEEADLGAVVPGSQLVVVTKNGRQQNGSPDNQTVFKLTLGEATTQERQFCYTCGPVPPPEPPPSESRTNGCTVFVTVPAKQAQPGPEAQPTPQPDRPSDSGSFQPSVFGWLILSVATCQLGLTVHL